jgi:hypothetical protein
MITRPMSDNISYYEAADRLMCYICDFIRVITRILIILTFGDYVQIGISVSEINSVK